MAKYSGKIVKKRKWTKKVEQPTTHAYHYESQKEDRGVLAKTKGYDTRLSGTKKEKRGRNKAGTHSKHSNVQTSGAKVRNRRANKQNKSRKGGK